MHLFVIEKTDKFSAHDTFLEMPSLGMLKVKRLESQKH